MSQNRQESSGTDRPTDQVLADRVAEVADRIKAGEPVDLDAIRKEEPELADHLLDLLPALNLLARLGQSASTAGLASVGTLPPDDSGEGIGRLGEFILLRQIARGGMGVVFEARQQWIGRRVALKILPAVAALDPQQLRRFEVEVRAAGALHHEHIVPIYSVGCEAGVHYYAMQLIEGWSLAEVIAKLRQGAGRTFEPAEPQTTEKADPAAVTAADDDDGETQPDRSDLAPTQVDPTALGPSHPGFVARLGLQAAEALEHAHREEVIHRDIKPGNLLLDNDGRLWIADFGLARLQGDSSLTATGVLVGTFRYMSPEQAVAGRGIPVDHRTDLYSLGATLYELLTLRPPFDDADGRVALSRISEETPPSIRKLNPAVPIDLETVVLKAMAKDPNDRYATAAELADDLRRFLEGRHVLARRPSPLDLASRWAYRHRLAVASAVVLLMLVTAALGVAVVLIAREQSRTADALAKVETAQSDLITAKNRADENARLARQSERMARELLYVADLKLAATALDDRDPLLMKEYLDRQLPEAGKPDLRDFAWWFLRKQGELPLDEWTGPGPALYFIAFSPDDRLMATCGEEAVIRLYRRPGDRLVREIPTGQIEVNGVAFSPDGQSLASAGDDGTVRLWDLETGEQIRQIQAVDGGKAYQVAFAMGGSMLISCGQEPIIRLWDAATGDSIGELRGPEADETSRAVQSIAVSPDGRSLAAAGPEFVARVWDLESRSVAWERIVESVRSGWISFSPDGDRVAVSRKRGFFAVSDWKSGEVVFEWQLRDDAESLAMLRGGTVLAIADRAGMIHLLPLPTPDGSEPSPGPPELHLPWLAHDDRIYALAASPDGETLFSAGSDGRLRRWHPFDPDGSRERFARLEPFGCALHPDGRTVLLAERGGVRILDPGADDPDQFLRLGDADFSQLMLDREGRLLAVDGRPTGHEGGRSLIVVRDLDAGNDLLQWQTPEGSHIGAIDLSADGRRLAAYVGRAPEVPVGDRVSVLLFDLQKGGPPRIVPMPNAQSFGHAMMVAFSPDGKLLAASDGHDVRLLDPQTGQTFQILTGEHSGTAHTLAFGPNGRLLASAGDDRRLVIWDLEAGTTILSTLSQGTDIRSLSFSPDGRLLASAGTDRKVLLWHVPTRQVLLEVPLSDPFPDNPLGWYGALATFGPANRRLAIERPGDLLVLDASPNASGP
ncbi:serine/threonine-protein kinase [Tautonia marina]|uniref:serine/threonine-protein kinase n=1 Tax=Tautonia marina TaxID=2653855 RepID=UPI001260872B|nr:serine/threonine-protein kinase [Tautonia marina]